MTAYMPPEHEPELTRRDIRLLTNAFRAHVQAVCKDDSCGSMCNVCNLAVCSVCGAYEGSLTTDCPGVAVPSDQQDEVFKSDLDFTIGRGWHRRTVTNRISWPEAIFL